MTFERFGPEIPRSRVIGRDDKPIELTSRAVSASLPTSNENDDVPVVEPQAERADDNLPADLGEN